MNIKEFLKNPVGKGAVIPGKNTLLADLDKRYSCLLYTSPSPRDTR